ncbi:MAG TPA: hypothetical protein PLC80_01715 [Draconibacterium sp.]|nr:hypothetical protein [Draconibacterium sp.]
MARDKIGRFRCIYSKTDITTKSEAEDELKSKMDKISHDSDFKGFVEQGDEPSASIDLLSIPKGIDKKQLHPYFLQLIDLEHFEPARKVIAELSKWMFPADKHFVNEFQRFQFDQRLWEIYLWATFRELGYQVMQHESPDFECKNFLANFLVEATTISPSQSGVLAKHPNPTTEDEYQKFLEEYMPMKVGSALTSKLNKRNAQGDAYWDMPHVQGKPFILAIEDFHKAADLNDVKPGSMVYSQTAFFIYLYGNRVIWEKRPDGTLYIETAPVKEHNYEDKTIPSGFFDLEGAENISAILFSNSGTISKFTRMGVCAGFGKNDFKYVRAGMLFNPDPNAEVGIPFKIDVASEKYGEFWSDDLQLFHNPNAKYPLKRNWFPNVTHHYFEDGKFLSLDSALRVLSSVTLNIRIKKNK